jgi:Flp pilus assembly protein TadD
LHLYYGLRDYNGALAELEKARTGLTNDPRLYALTGFILRRQGKAEDGARELGFLRNLACGNLLTDDAAPRAVVFY